MTKTEITTIGVVGAGTMGAGIALTALYADFKVVLHDPYPEALEKAEKYIRDFLAKKDQSDKTAKLVLTDDLGKLAPVQVVIEAALEKMDVKQELFRQLEAVCSPEAILASNTSTLSVTEIAAACAHPERVAGMHFFNPAPVLPLVEVVRAAQSSQATVETLVALAERLGKTAVVTGDTPGFIVNRVARPFYGEALRLLGEGVADHATIDRIVEQGGGFRMGPFKLMDLIGIDINAGAMRSMYEQTYGEPRYRPHWLQMQKVREGALGRKTGRGFYEYKDEGGGMKDEGKALTTETQRAQSDKGAKPGKVLISEGSWAPGLAEMVLSAGYQVEAVADGDETPVACFVVAGRAEEAARLLAWYDGSLSPEVPLIAQAADVSWSEMAGWVQHPGRLVGFDGLFLQGSVVTLEMSPGRNGEVIASVEELFGSMEKQVQWVGESPALVLPRIVGQLVNEAAFAVLEGVAEAETIDLAMRLGVNYPRGPLEWGAALGYDKVLAVLDHLYAEYHEERYRACVLLRRWARNSR